jgi:hypothetical protein
MSSKNDNRFNYDYSSTLSPNSLPPSTVPPKSHQVLGEGLVGL